jgi:hypothetical protein
MRTIFNFSLTFLLFAVFSACSQKQFNPEKEKLWNQISGFFSPPEEFQGEYGEYRSPLKFYNGDSVRSAGDWAKRKEEIKTRWHELMGEWPELITGP